MNILQLISSGGMYGAEAMLVNLASSLEQLGCRCVVGVFANQHRPHTEIAERARARGLTVELVHCGGRLDRRALARIRKIIQERHIEIVHTHGYKAAVYGYLATRKSEVARVATCHNWPNKALHMQMYAWVERVILGRFQRIVAVSEPVAKMLGRFVRRDNLLVIANGIDVECFSHAVPTLSEVLPGKRHVVAMVGRLVPGKGPEVLLYAARSLLCAHPNVAVVFVGDGPCKDSLQHLAYEMGVASSVVFAGERNDMPGVYASLDVLVLPSLDEGMPMTVLEAMAAGKPVVASNVGGISKAVVHGETGLLVPAGQVAALAQAISRLLTDRQLAVTLGNAGRKRAAELFSAVSMAEQYRHTYCEALKCRALAN
jgi:glycosyltransferase involved in cell wall biosynthesis